ncbi:aldose 1-epimerase [Rhizobiaceae sp. 2RAB30]
MTSVRLALAAGLLQLELSPEHGGAVAAFRLATPSGPFDLFRPSPDGEPGALFSGCFPMVPFANCIRDNRFAFGGRIYEVPPNMPANRLNFHGSGWQSAWTVAASGRTSAELLLAEGIVGEAYRYGAVQRFELAPDSLEITTTLTNRGDLAMPFSFGQHPWFPRHGDARLRFAASGRWRADGEGQAEALVPLADDTDYEDWREPPRAYRNDCYAGWPGRAEIDWPDAGVGMIVKADRIFGHLMFHVPRHDPEVFCLEPQTNAPCAFDGLEKGETSAGVIVLGSGESVAGTMRFRVRPPDPAHN